MKKKTVRRNIDVVSKEEWKALVKAQELNRTQLLRSGMGTGTGTGTEEQSHFYSFGEDFSNDFSFENITWDMGMFAMCVVEVKNNEIVSIDANFSYSFVGGSGTGSYGQYSNADLQGNSIYGSNAGCYAYHNDTASTVLHGIGFTIDGSAIDEEGDPVHFSYAQTTRDVRLSCRAYFDETGQLRIEPEIEVIYY